MNCNTNLNWIKKSETVKGVQLNDYINKVTASLLEVMWSNDILPNNFLEFLDNQDHWIEHTFNVYKKALEIADIYTKKTWVTIDLDTIYIMSVMHDAWRFHFSKNSIKQEKCERHHNECWAAQLRLFRKRLLQKWINVSDEKYNSILDYILNHDYMTERLDWKYLKEPKSIEGQIVRLADRISTDVRQEVRRYWATWKRRKTLLYNPNITLDDRVSFSYDRISEYIVKWKLDQIFFFLTLISITWDEFSDKILSEIYDEWSLEKENAIDEILKIADEEWYDRIELSNIIMEYLNYFNIKINKKWE